MKISEKRVSFWKILRVDCPAIVVLLNIVGPVQEGSNWILMSRYEKRVWQLSLRAWKTCFVLK